MAKAPNKEIIQQWVDALRSGKYEQGTGALASYDTVRNTMKYCCLGVLCELAKDAGIVQVFGIGQYGKDEMDRRGGFLPDSVTKWAGLDPGDYGDVRVKRPEGGGRECASSMNDKGKSFEEIAASIEATLLQERPDGE